MLKNFEDLLKRAKELEPIRLAVAAAEDEDVLLSIKEAASLGLVAPILVGNEAAMAALAAKVGLTGFDLVHDPDAPALTAVRLVSQGRARAVMKGLINTSDFMRAVLHSEGGLKSGRRLSHLTALEIPGEDRLIFVTDGAITPAPDLAAKREIIDNALTVLYKLGYAEPKVALLAANEQVSPKIPATFEAAELVKIYRAEADAWPGVLEGPVALDVAASPEAARHKKIDSAVSGRVDLFVVPNIEAGNVLIKSLLHWGRAVMAGMVVGAAAPVIMTSRSDTPRGKLLSIALGALTA